MKEVDAELYEFLQNNETTIYKEDGRIEVAVFVYFFQLENFAKVVGRSCFDDGGLVTRMMYNYLCIPITDYIEGCGHNISSYKNCFENDVWRIYEKEILEMERDD